MDKKETPPANKTGEEEKAELANEIHLLLGGQMVDVELDQEHIDLAIKLALRMYRQRSSNATMDYFIPFKLIRNKDAYDLSINSRDADVDREIVDVKDLYIRSTGNAGTGTGSELEPFHQAHVSAFLQQSGRAGGLGVYDFIAQHYELIGRIFGAEFQFTWDRVAKSLLIHRRVKADVHAVLHTFSNRNDYELMTDQFSSFWIQSYALARSKIMLGQARAKFSQMAGPAGGTTLDGEALKAEGQQEIEKLEDDLIKRKDGGKPIGSVCVIG